MRKQHKPAPAPESPDIARLAEVVEGLTRQVQHLAMILDEVREDLVWAVRNDKFHCAGHSQQYVASYTAPPPEAKDDEAEETEPSPNPAVPPKQHYSSDADFGANEPSGTSSCIDTPSLPVSPPCQHRWQGTV